MPQISAQEFERVPLRVHAFLDGVPLHDAWAVELPRSRADVTLDEFISAPGRESFTPPPAVRMLLNLRFFIGRLFGWDRMPSTSAADSFADRLTRADRARSLAPAGAPDGLFCVIYRFENERLVELRNRTVHAAVLDALIETPESYRYYLAVYVRSVGRITPVYLALIDPFRKLVVYPALLRGIAANWKRAMADCSETTPLR